MKYCIKCKCYWFENYFSNRIEKLDAEPHHFMEDEDEICPDCQGINNTPLDSLITKINLKKNDEKMGEKYESKCETE